MAVTTAISSSLSGSRPLGLVALLVITVISKPLHRALERSFDRALGEP